MSSVRFAPSAAHAIRRVTVIVAASALVSLVLLAAVGWPSAARARPDREGGPYGPTPGFGLVQLLGQTALLGAGVYVARRWLKVRL